MKLFVIFSLALCFPVIGLKYGQLVQICEWIICSYGIRGRHGNRVAHDQWPSTGG